VRTRPRHDVPHPGAQGLSGDGHDGVAQLLVERRGWIASPGLVVGAQGALLFEIPLAFFLGGALVVRLLAVRDADFHLGAVLLPVHRQRHQRQALAFDRADQLVDFRAMQQQLAGAAVFGDHVGGCRQQRRNRCADQKQFALQHHGVRVGEIDAPRAQTLHFPALQRNAGLVALVDVVLVARALVERDQESPCRSIARRWSASRRSRCSISSMRSKLTRAASTGASVQTFPNTMANTWSRASTCVLPGSPSIFPPATRWIAPAASGCSSSTGRSTGCTGCGLSRRSDRKAARWRWISTSKSATP